MDSDASSDETRFSGPSSAGESDDDDEWKVPPPSAKKRKMMVLSDEDEEDEKAVPCEEMEDDSKGKVEQENSDSNESVAATEVIREVDDDPEDLLSIPSYGSPEKDRMRDFKMEDGPIPIVTFPPSPPPIKRSTREVSPATPYESNDDGDFSEGKDDDDGSEFEVEDSDDNYSVEEEDEETSDDDEEEDWVKPKAPTKTKARPLSESNMQGKKKSSSFFEDHDDDDEEEEEDDLDLWYGAKKPKRGRPKSLPASVPIAPLKKEDFWGDEADNIYDQNTPPTYNPDKARDADWHGDVKRTVNMLTETIKEMPMPGDEEEAEVKHIPGLVTLYDHQKYALRWMNWREGQFPGGGILADEMGLGKTIEIISLLMKSKRAGVSVGTEEAKKCLPSSSTLVVAPLGCIRQWEKEIAEKASGALRVYVYHGPKKKTTAAELMKYDVVITTYHTLAGEIPPPNPEGKLVRCRSPLKRIYWLRIVLDEAHQIRNPRTKAAIALFQIEARHRWAVTGTPIHNRPEDFFSMCKFLRLEPFDERGVWDFWIGLKMVRPGAEERLHTLGKALILRRTKQEVGLMADGKGGPEQIIPPKVVEVVDVELSEEERRVYDMFMEYAKNILREFLSQKEQREQGLREGGLIFAGQRLAERREEMPEADIKFSHIFALLIRLRQLAVLPHLIHTMLQEEELRDEAFDEKKPEHVVSMKNPLFDENYLSSKFRRILDDIDELRAKAKEKGVPMDKVIVVSSWTSTLDRIHGHLLERNYTCVFITGREDMNLRMENQERFNKNRNKPQILLLSLMAGGVGLNLVGANHVYFMEPHWNPQHELQAQDRVHRFGQTKDVVIRRYIAEDTIESRIMELQKAKRELADGLLENTKKRRGAGLSLNEMKLLFDLTRPMPPPPPPPGTSKKAKRDAQKNKKKNTSHPDPYRWRAPGFAGYPYNQGEEQDAYQQWW